MADRTASAVMDTPKEPGAAAPSADSDSGQQSDEATSHSSLWHWGRLLRLPNLLTVPGDPLAGGILAAGGAPGPENIMALCGAMLGSLLFYAGGLIDNDLVDLGVDRRERPGRPLCSGEVSVRAARTARMLAGLLGLGILAGTTRDARVLLVGILLVLCIGAYNRIKQYSVPAAAVLMGGCRALSLLLGSVAVGGGARLPVAVWLAAAGWLTYIAAVTAVAANETRTGVAPFARFGPALAALGLALAAALVPLGVAHAREVLIVAGALGGFMAVRVGAALGAQSAPAVIQRSIGEWIRGLLWLQAAVCLLLPGVVGTVFAVALGAVYVLAGVWGRRFYAS